MHSLGIDVGSSNVKVALVDADGSLVAAAGRPLRTSHAGEVVEQDPDELWDAVAAAVREITSAHPGVARSVRSLGVCSQYSSIVPVAADGTAAGPLVMYLDRRGTEHCWAILERHPDAFDTWVARHGIPPIGAGLSLAHVLHMQLDRTDLHDRTSAYLEAMDLVNLRFTGRVAATQCTAFAGQLCDNRTVGATSYDDDLIAMSGVDRTRLPPLIEVDGVHGTVLDDVAGALGLPTGVTVLAGMNDTQACAFATGAFDPGCTGVIVGTTAVIVDSVDGFGVDLDREVLSMPSPVRGRHLVMAENGVAGSSVAHVVEDLLAGPDGAGSFEELERALETSAPGAGGVLFLPWLAGSLSPRSDPSMRGGFLGVTLQSRRDDLLRATVEGTARNLRWLLPAVEELSGARSERLVFGGGAARSPGWARTLADVLGRPVAVLDRPEVAAARAVGTVALRRVLGEDPLDAPVAVGSTWQPDSAATAVHDRLQPIFETSFEATRPICEALGP